MLEITIFGLVQGVGFRPFVAEAARELSITGTVWNAGGIVKVRAASCDAEALDEFVRRLSSCSIPGARVDEVRAEEIEDTVSEEGFRIVESQQGEDEKRFFPADIATCENCERELMDPGNRRYRYPFISCVSCGPRYSIMEAVPYDRERTTMKEFSLCDACRREYEQVGDIRCYAQTIACAECGPELRLYESAGGDVSKPDAAGENALSRAASMLKEGRVLAVKGIGGYHFCFDPESEEAAVRLREYKNRENKPLAVMFPDVDAIREKAVVSETEERLLTSAARPIVLVDKKEGEDFAPSVCGTSTRIGAMLPCNPIQILLMQACGPLVMTSGNPGGEPIVTEDAPMVEALGKGFPDAVLAYNRDIVNGLDDSICQVVKLPEGIRIEGENPARKENEIVQILRRARGFVPEPVELPCELSKDMFAAGGDLKSVFAIGRGRYAYMSGHFGDLENPVAGAAREQGIAHLEEVLDIHPEQAVCDRHPGYFSVKKLDNPIKIQHHYAHIASVMAEHGIKGPVLGVAFDGTGYGDDGSIWGSEILRCDGADYERRGSFLTIPLIGGDASAKDARTILYAYLNAALNRNLLTEGEITEIVNHLDGAATVNNYHIVASALDAKVNIVYSSSMGRLFDAAAALLHIGFQNSYEGECAELLEAAAEKWLRGRDDSQDEDEIEISDVWAPVKDVKTLGVWQADGVYLLAGLARRMLYGDDPSYLAYEFHLAVADATTELLAEIRGDEKEIPVALGGGCMCNRLLLELLIPKLSAAGFPVYINEKVPSGDGGLAPGQLYAAYLSEKN